MQSSIRLHKSPLVLSLLKTKEIAADASSSISTIEIPLSKHSPSPSLNAHNSEVIFELTLMDFANPITHWPALSLSKLPHLDSPLILTTEPSVFSLCQPSASFNHYWTCFNCLSFPMLGLQNTVHKLMSLHFHHLNQIWVRRLLLESPFILL